MHQIKYSESFVNSLSNQIDYWEKQLFILQEQIENYVSLIYTNIKLLADFPYICQDVKELYHFSESTYRMTIGKQYAIFYRVNEENKIIMIGSFFNNKQMQIEF